MAFLAETGGLDMQSVSRLRGAAKALGNGHAVIEYEPPWGRVVARWAPSFGEAKKADIAAIQRKLEARFDAEWAYRVGQTSRDLPEPCH